ncbi:CDP-archaeol synthase [Candidatus Saccharibacteria bacterium]|nr:CDP-archaeol synthase [Candidatus Saccharibacteria bacterium]
MNDLFMALIFFMPAGIANSIPPVVNKIPIIKYWKTPIDFNYKLKGQELFGKNKTWRGLLIGTLIGGLSAWFIYPILNNSIQIEINSFLMGCLLGFGALLGDVIESFFKRRLGIASGKAWLGFDQLDYVLGGILISAPFVSISAKGYASIIVVYFVLHFVVSYIGFIMGIKENPFKLT